MEHLKTFGKGILVGVAVATTAMVLLLATGTVRGQDRPKPATSFKKFILVPYAQAFDEVVIGDVRAGKYKEADFPGWLRYADQRFDKGGLERKLGIDDKWKIVKDEDLGGFFAPYFFSPNTVIPTQDNDYFVEETLYAKYAGRLIPQHAGHLLHVQTPERIGREKIGELGSGDLRDYDSIVYDYTDKAWRFPVTLARAKANDLVAGKPVKELPTPMPPKKQVGGATTIFDLLDDWEKQHQKLRAADYLKKAKTEKPPATP